MQAAGGQVGICPLQAGQLVPAQAPVRGQVVQRVQVIWADSAGGSTTAAQQLYNAIGAGNLRAWVDGQDNVGYAALSN